MQPLESQLGPTGPRMHEDWHERANAPLPTALRCMVRMGQPAETRGPIGGAGSASSAGPCEAVYPLWYRPLSVVPDTQHTQHTQHSSLMEGLRVRHERGYVRSLPNFRWPQTLGSPPVGALPALGLPADFSLRGHGDFGGGRLPGAGHRLKRNSVRADCASRARARTLYPAREPLHILRRPRRTRHTAGQTRTLCTHIARVEAPTACGSQLLSSCGQEDAPSQAWPPTRWQAARS